MSTYINPNKNKKLEYEDCPPLLRDYIDYMLAVKNRSKRTVNSYYIDLHLFFRFIALLKGYAPADTPIEDVMIGDMTEAQMCAVEEENIYKFIYYVRDDRDNSAETEQHKLTSIQSFYHYVVKVAKLLEKSPADDVERPSLRGKASRQPVFLKVQESQDLLKAVSGQFPERDYCIICLFINCGLRLSELTSINLKDMSDRTIKIVGKGNKTRTVYLNDMCIDAIAAYREIRDAQEYVQEKNALFISKQGKRLSNRQVENIVKKHLTAAGLLHTGCTPHKLRHTAATMYYQSGAADLQELARLLGHSSTKTTEIYTHLDEKALERVVSKSPLMASQEPLISIVSPEEENAKEEGSG